ncbi:hypothetical protein C8F04DRAFT_1084053 [Mycena alexandri]|uniref:Uncharacterized protein n=1 Tax=Mycena alexandri TaxID=1745969 RepID=A0AAD6XCF2_9AGAR|nr:hypothetical protein C8F04DRAFT_1084053 [Mycena alexandri]
MNLPETTADHAANSWLPQLSQQASMPWDETAASMQPNWNDFGSSVQSVPNRPPSIGSSAGDFFNDDYDFQPVPTRAPSTSSSAEQMFDDGYSFKPMPTRPPSTSSSTGDFFYDDYDLQSVPTRPPSTSSSAGQFFDEGYGIDLLMAGISDGYPSSAFSSALPSDEDMSSSHDWSSTGSRPVSAAPSSVEPDIPGNSPPSVSVEIAPRSNCPS